MGAKFPECGRSNRRLLSLLSLSMKSVLWIVVLCCGDELYAVSLTHLHVDMMCAALLLIHPQFEGKPQEAENIDF